MRNLLFLVVMLMTFTFVGAVNVPAQTINDEVRVSAGAVRIEDSDTFTVRGELRKAVSDRIGFNDIGSVTTNGDITLFRNAALLRFEPVEHVFVAGGIGVGKLTDTDTFVNPVVQAGANFSFSRVNFEPFVQLETPDLASDSNVRSLSANLNVKVGVTEQFGLFGQASARSSRLDNKFFTESFSSLEKTATIGVYFNWD